MAVEETKKPIQIKFNKQSSGYFDEIFNCRLSNRKADTGFIEEEKAMLGPREGSIRVGNALAIDWSSATTYVVGDVAVYQGELYKCITGHTNSVPPSANWSLYTDGTSKEFFYTDRQNIRRAYRVFANKLYYLNASTWTSIGDVNTTDVEFSTQKVPMLNIRPWSSTTAYTVGTRVTYNGVIYNCTTAHTNSTPPSANWAVSSADPVEYTVGGATTVAEKVKHDPADTPNANQNVGKILLVTSGVYKGCYASIIARDATDYTLGGSGVLTGLAAGTKYKLFDYVGNALCVCRGSSSQDELFYDGILPLAHLTGYVTASLRQVAALAPTESVSKLVVWQNQVWTFAGGTLYYTGGFPGNPFFFNFTTALTVGGNGSVVDIFTYKSRLVVNGTNYIFSVPTSLLIDRHVTSYGAIKDAYVSNGDDVYIFTTQKTLVSLNETIAGVVQIKNAGEAINNYLKTFNTKLCFGSDSQKVYLYGQQSATGDGYLCVLDTLYNFWSIYTGLKPRSIVSEGGVTYIADNHTDIVRVLSDQYTTDVAVGTSNTTTFSQLITSKEIDLSDIFTPKIIADIYIAFENYTQSITLEGYVAINGRNGAKVKKKASISEVSTGDTELGKNNLGLNLFGGSSVFDIISVPIMKHAQYSSDPTNLFKFRMYGTDGSPFYISQIDVLVSPYGEQKGYFDPANTF